jgi:hypothetical protein
MNANHSTLPISFMAILLSQATLNESLFHKAAGTIPEQHNLICIKDQCRGIDFFWRRDMLFATWSFQGQSFIGWAEPCVDGFYEEFDLKTQQVANDLLSRIKHQFPEAEGKPLFYQESP